MTMEEEELRQRKLEELQQQQARQREEEQKKADAENRMHAMLAKALDEPARQRVANVRMVNPELYAKAFQAIMSLVQKGYVRGKISDEQMREILRQLSEKRETKIDFRRK